MKKEALGTLLALLTAVVSGFAIPVNKIFVSGLDPVVFTAVRAIFIGAIFFILAGYKKGFKFRSMNKVPWSWLLLIGIIGGGLGFLLYFSGLTLTTSGRAAFLHKTLPIYVAVFSYLFLKEKITRKQNMTLLVMLIGTVILLSSSINPSVFWQDPALGDILVVLGTIMWGLENTISRKALIKEESSLVVSFSRMFFGGAFLFGVALLLGRLDVLLNLTQQQMASILISSGLLFAYILFWYSAIRLINVSKAVLFLLLAPVISMWLGVLWFGEPVPPLQVLGSVLILAGAAFAGRIRSEFSDEV
ncbi:MAG: DMT family transporter [Candidatus Aenigmarchaeota archaeon]|nr:DMT family transporter [Candidatus Aenigmarchaeota archaeon]